MGLRDALIVSPSANVLLPMETFASLSLAHRLRAYRHGSSRLFTGSTPAKQADDSFFASRIQTRNAIRKLLLMNFLESYAGLA